MSEGKRVWWCECPAHENEGGHRAALLTEEEFDAQGRSRIGRVYCAGCLAAGCNPMVEASQRDALERAVEAIGGGTVRILEGLTPAERKTYPVATGVLDYFPNALALIGHVSFVGNEQHNPGTPLHWDRSKSGDEADALLRHFLARGTTDTDGIRHSAKMAWRALALLEKELEAAK